MKRHGIAIVALGLTIGFARADNWATYGSPAANGAGYGQPSTGLACTGNGCAAGNRPVWIAKNGNGHGCATCGATGEQDGGRARKLLDFLLYRPLSSCNCCPEPAPYTPPLYVWFPSNGCTAAFHCGASCGCEKKCAVAGRMQPAGTCRKPNGCATCAARIGAPVAMAQSPSQNSPTPAAANKQSNTPTAIYPASTIMPPAKPAVVPATIVSPYGGLPGGYRVEPNRNVLPGRSDAPAGGQ